jgi:hypothetical protein
MIGVVNDGLDCGKGGKTLAAKKMRQIDQCIVKIGNVVRELKITIKEEADAG